MESSSPKWAAPASADRRWRRWIRPARRYTGIAQADPRAINAATDGAGAIVTIVLTGLRDVSNARKRTAARLATRSGCYAEADELPGGAGLIVRGLAVDSLAVETLVGLVQSSLVGSKDAWSHLNLGADGSDGAA